MRALILSGIYWDDPWQRHQQIAKYLAKCGYSVVFVEHIVSSKFSIEKLVKKIERRDQRRECQRNERITGIEVFHSYFINPDSVLTDLINKVEIKRILNTVGRQFDLVINYLPISTTLDIVNKITYKKLVYDCVRNFEVWPGYSNKVKKNELKLIRKSDSIFTDSYYLTNKMISIKGSKFVYQFLPSVNGEWENGIKKKKIQKIQNLAYFGSVDAGHIDLNVFQKLNEIGYNVHVWGVASENITKICTYHGYKSNLKELVRDIYNYTDAIILTYKGDLEGVIPSKMFQCLSLGIPVYISEFYDSIRLKNALFVYKDVFDLIDKIESFSDQEYSEKRINGLSLVEKAREYNQYAEFKKILDKIME